MRTQLLKNLILLLFVGLALSAREAAAQMLVGSNGLPAQTFDAAPPTTSWATKSGGASSATAITNTTQLDANVQTNTAASISTALPTSGTVPPATSGTAQWNSAGRYIQSRPTGNTYTMLKATLRNNSGTTLTNITVAYDLGALVSGGTIVEEIPGLRAYFSFTGDVGTWVHIPQLDSATASEAGRKQASINITNWAPNAFLYIAWADDNGSASTTPPNLEGGYTIDNFAIAIGCGIAVPPSDQNIVTGGTLNLGVTAAGGISYQWFRNGAEITGATNATYTKANMQPADSGLYSVRVTHCGGTEMSRVAVVSVAPAGYTLFTLTNKVWRYNQTGTALPAEWRNPGYNDSSWLTGRGAFAGGEDAAAVIAITNTTLSLTGSDGSRAITYYFRTTFELTNNPAGIILTTTNIWDDGMVVYVNGTEAYRTNLPTGTINASTLALAAQTEGVFVNYVIPSSALVVGTNTLAVEVHQSSATSSDIVFGMAASVNFPNPTVLTVTQDVQNLVVEEAKPAVFRVGVDGVPAYYQWYKGPLGTGVAITNGTANPYTIPIVTPADAGSYYVVASNVINSVTSGPVTLTVLADTNRPTIVEADGTHSLSTVLVSFSERLLGTQATNTGSYRITNTLTGAQLTISRATLTNGTNVLLETSARNTTDNYILVVNNVRDISAAQNQILPNSSIPVSRLVVIVPLLSANYRYYQPQYPPPLDQPDQGTVWKETSFTPPASWPSGTSPFFYSVDGYDEIPWPPQTTLGDSMWITSYYRTLGTANVSPGGATLYLQHYIDDGGVFYLNGREIFRFNMPATNNYDTRARAVDQGILSEPVVVDSSALVQGQNLLAFELHQAVPNDQHAAYAAELRVKAQSLVTGPIVLTGGPGDLTVFEGQPATFSVAQAGGLTFQWQRNSNNIAGATNGSYTIPVTTLADNNTYYRVTVSSPNDQTPEISTNAVLRVIADTNRPVLLSGTVKLNNTIELNFSERMGAASVANLQNFRVTNSTTGGLVPIQGASVSGTNVILSFASLPYAQYFVFVSSNLTDAATGANKLGYDHVVKVGFNEQVIAINGTWKYDQSGVDLAPSAWMQPSFNDAGWPSGPGLLDGKRDGRTAATLPFPVGTVLAYPENGPGGIYLYTTYFRTRFNSYVAGAGTLTLETVMDDGAIIYLNGQEIFRRRMPAGTPAFDTQASSSVGDAPFEGPFVIEVSNLQAGENVLAVEIHQNGTASSDVTWGANVQVTSPPGVTVIVPPTNGPCTAVSWSAPVLNYQRLSSNTVQLSWTNPVTNTCSNRLVFRLEQSLSLSNPVSATVWTNLGTNSPRVITTTNPASFFRLRNP